MIHHSFHLRLSLVMLEVSEREAKSGVSEKEMKVALGRHRMMIQIHQQACNNHLDLHVDLLRLT